MPDSISLLFSQSFLVRALVVGVLISLCCALLGVSLVLKRFSMIGDGLSHVGFGAMAIACAANIAPLYFSLPIVLVAAFMLLRLNEKGKIKGDAAIALISTGALATGVMVTSMTTGMNIDIYNYMFGSILTMSNNDVIVSAIISVIVAVLFVLFYNEIFSVTFDESFSQATGTKASVYNMLIAGLTAVTIVIGMRMMGALLISALIIFPAVTSMRVCKSFRSVIVSSAAISVFCFVFGLIFSINLEAPTGASIVCINIVVFLFLSLVSKIKSNVKNTALKKCLKMSVICVFICTMIWIPFLSETEFRKNDKLSIVTVGFAEYDFARQIVKDEGEVIMLLSPGQESHTFEPTPTDIVKIEQCDVFIYTGGESESWVDRVLESIDNDISIVKMMDVCILQQGEHSHEEAHGHNHEEHGEYDEHVWTSPVNAKLIVEKINDAICSVDSENKDFYTANTKGYIEKLDKTDSDFRLLAESSKDKYIVIGDRFPLRYLMLEYGIEYYAAYPGCSAQVEVNPATIARLNEMVKNDDIPVIFKVDLSSGSVAGSIIAETGAMVDTLYSCHVISSADFALGETYISLMNRNLEALKIALK